MLARFLLGMAVVIQGAAAILTFRLARKTEWRLSWSLVTGALLLLAARRAYTFALVVQGERTLGLMENLSELTYAALFFLGLFLLQRLLFTSQGKEAHAVAYGSQVRDILESINEAFFALDEHLVFTYFNHAAEQLTGLKREEVLGKPFLNAFPDGRAFEATYQKALAEQQARTFVEYYPKPLDAWFEVRVFPQSRGLTVYFINISERKKLEEERERAAERIENEVKKRTRELERQRDFTRRILDNVPANITYTDRHYNYVLSNPNNDRVMGVGKLEGRNVFEALPGSEPTVKPVLDKVFESRQPFSASAWPLSYTIEGKPVQQYYDVTFLPVEGEEGQVEGILGLAVEVSERVMREKLQQEQLRTLRESDRLKDEFLSVLSHELRTPLNAVMGFGSFLEDELGGPLTAQQREFVDKILKGGERMIVLIDDLLDFARMQAGTFGISCEETDVAALIEEVVATFEPATSEKRLSIRTRIEVPRPVRLDRQRIFQVLANLVNNAVKFTPAGGWIELRAFLDGEHLVTEVADSGVGLAPEDIPKLFQPFKQLDMSLTRRTGGVGLGLSISRGIVEAHGGKITAESAGPGRGATFRFWLPTS